MNKPSPTIICMNILLKCQLTGRFQDNTTPDASQGRNLFEISSLYTKAAVLYRLLPDVCKTLLMSAMKHTCILEHNTITNS